MPTSARIEELKKKFDENPRRYFAPLANEFRKLGDFDQAILICQEFLPQQPGHMSGHIVYGQALFEAGRLDEARGVFETALSLDPENLIALRHLGDICREHGDIEGARSWYRRVLDADPRNEEIASVLATLDEPTSVPWTTPTPKSVGSVPVEATASSEPVVEQPLETAPPEKAIVDFHDMLLRAAEEAPLDSSSKEQRAEGDAGAAAELIDLDVGDFAAGARPSVVDDLLVERAVDTPFGFESPPALDEESASSVLPDGERVLAEPPESTPVSAHPPVSARETAPDEAPPSTMPAEPKSLKAAEAASAAPQVQAGGRAEAPASQPPGAPEFVTETMAELYVQQGHLTEAVGVYRQLVVRYPGDEVLRARLEELDNARREADSRRPTPPAAAEPKATEPAPPEETSVPTPPSFAATPPTTSAPPAPEPRVPERWQSRPFAAPVEPEPQLQSSRRQFAEPEPTAVHEPDAPKTTESGTVESRPSDTGGARLLDDLAIDEAFVESTLAPAAGGTTIRDFLSGLARKRPASTNGSEPSGGGYAGGRTEPEPEHPEADFESAAARYAEIPGAPRIDDLDMEISPPERENRPEPPRSETPGRHDALSTIGGSIDILFSGTESSREDEQAASTLAEAFSPESATGELGGKPARRAQDELSLDHVFRERGGTERSPSSFSFDQFFAQGADRAPSGAEPSSGEGEENDDIQQFNAWLEGLKKT